MALVKHTIKQADGTNRETTNWYFRFEMNGKIYFGSTKTSNKQMAARIERKKYNDALEQMELGGLPVIATNEALKEYLGTQKANTEYKSVKRYVAKMLGTKGSGKNDDVIINIYGFDPTKPFHALSNADVQKLIIARRAEGNADATIILELVEMSKAIRMVGKLGYQIPTIDFKELKQENKLKPAKKKLRYLTPDEETRLFVELDPAKAKNWQVQEERLEMREFVIVLLDTGARYSEIATLEWAQVDMKEKTIDLWRSKVANESILSMTDRLYETLQRRFEKKRADQTYVFENSNKDGPRNYAPKAFNNACKRAGILNCTLKTCRKTFASWLVQAGVPLMSVSKLLGHASITTTASFYAFLAPNQASKEAAQVLNKIDKDKKS
ncbi:MAG: site-specific integrase [Steroidobacteraceae bacterium]